MLMDRRTGTTSLLSVHCIPFVQIMYKSALHIFTLLQIIVKMTIYLVLKLLSSMINYNI
jgi:hypothetical protein